MAKVFKKLSVGADAFVYHEGKRFRKLIYGITPEAGLYDANGVMLASWETLVNTYNMCVWSHLSMYDYGVLLSSIIENNGEFENATKLIIDASVGEVTCAFGYCKTLTTIIIPEGIKAICWRALNFSTALTSISIPDSVEYIENVAFDGCTSLANVTIGKNVKTIYIGAFADCTSLTSVTVGVGVTSIGLQAFRGCTALKDVYYRGTEEQWNAIEIESGNECLTNATIHYNYTD